MIPVLFINSRSVPFVDMILKGEKIYETRNRHVLRSAFLYDMPILIAETGKGKPLVKCSARIRSVIEIFTAEEWEKYRMFHSVPIGSEYDWKPETKKKVLYELCDVRPVSVPFVPAEGKRHGRTWMEYNGKKV